MILEVTYLYTVIPKFKEHLESLRLECDLLSKSKEFTKSKQEKYRRAELLCRTISEKLTQLDYMVNGDL